MAGNTVYMKFDHIFYFQQALVKSAATISCFLWLKLLITVYVNYPQLCFLL